ncbi:glutamine synthetase catalytic region [Syntrophobotulus glycolicus DSM 8271]|uniref:Glutamine synthetase catalytic region n=1 Tax=Syntrophobotulus glycolicus (strain DSM 8271 / FlGlyR) TaxID=645991 RepID=F0SXS4_SYNGF|nr:glutamine synthetase III [Syntrophobotulus glycolicus]ADY56985.1 glutamine synthetase catalytic region [Syntrophobotulus glycolicus DSM 8271]
MEIFGSNVFNDTVMRARLPKATYKALKKTITQGTALEASVAETVASAMKDWAIEKGATHFTHWFHPMTGLTAEKHDSFISPTEDGKVIMEFSGKELIKGEPDASSFPSGGIRATFEARGYTVWDCTSPAFLKEDKNGSTILCIPTAFYSYTGETLDKKAPLLKSMEAVSKQALRVLKLFGNTTATKVISTVGPEQEYFLIDRNFFEQRMDLVLTGRTLFGAMPPKGQEMEDHYFGTIKERISSFMKELNEELWKLGILAKTQHNEVAPAQFEIAPIFSTTNVSTDHNQLVMDCLRKVALRHDLVCLLHEKPFAGVNGSGKHNNWSLGTDDGQNLLEPGNSPHGNAQFLTFLCAVIEAVDNYAELLRISAANPGNDHRLGANEAPPAIISIFLGDQLNDVINQLEKGGATSSKAGEILKVGVATLPEILKDTTDRNRTSPFAFTGNKFEFRMVPSSASIACPNMILNTIVAESLSQIADKLEKTKNFNKELASLLQDIIKKHKQVVFNGNNYSDEWVVEAEKRGLPNIRSMVEALPYYISEKSISLFTKHGVLTEGELHARYEILLEQYTKVINYEAKTMLDIAQRSIFPVSSRYAAELAGNILSIKDALGTAPAAEESLLKELVATNNLFLEKVNALEKAINGAAEIDDAYKLGLYAHDTIFAAMAELRVYGDKLETLIDAAQWPFPTYAEMLFLL